MTDQEKTREQLISELEDLRQQVSKLESAQEERQQAEEALKESNQRFKELANTLPQTVFEMNSKGELTFVNLAARTGYGYTEADISRKINALDMLVPEDRERAREALKRIGEGDPLTGNEYRALRKDGTTFPVIVHSSVIRKDGRVTGFRGIIIDITQRKQAEEELRLSEAKYRILIEQASDGILITDRDGNHLDANTRACEMLGYTRAELMSRNSRQNIHPDDLRDLPLQTPYLEPGKSVRTERRLIRKDGSIFDAEISGKLLEDGRLQAIFRDVTERKRAEEALRASEERFAKAFHASPDSIMISSFADGTYIDVNESFLKTTGYSREEVIGRTSIEMNVWGVVEERTRFVNELSSCGFVRSFEAVFRKKSGEEGICVMSADMITLSGQKCILAISSDITERKRAEQSLLEQEENYRLLFERNLAGVYRTTVDGRFLDCNDSMARILGYASRDELMAAEVIDIYHSISERDEIIGKLRQSGTLSNFEYKMRRKDGSSVWILENVSLMTEPGKPEVLQGTLIDISERKQTEEALKESEAKFRAVAENTPCAIFVYQESRFQFANPALETMTGYSRAELLAMDEVWTPLVHPDFRQLAHERLMNRIKAQQPAAHTEMKIIRKDGQIRWLEMTGQLVTFEGRPAVLATAYDITERKKAEEKLIRQEEFLRSVIDTDPNLIFVKDEAGTYRLVNKSVAEFHERSIEEVIGKTDFELNQDAEEVARFIGEDREVLATGRDIFISEGKATTPGGVARWFQVTKRPLISEDGRIRQVLGIANDITERKRAEEALAAEKERLSVTLRSIGDGVIATDTSGRVVLMNQVAEKLTGWTQSEAEGRNLDQVLQVLDEKNRTATPNPVDQVFNSRGALGFSLGGILVSRDSSERIISETAAPIRDRNSHIVGVVVAFRDITEKRKMEAEIQKASKLESVGVLAGGIAHDFNNILTAILGNISLAKIYAKPEDVGFKRLGEAEQACLRAKDLTQQLLTFSRGGAPIKKTSSVAGLLKDSASFALTGSSVWCDFQLHEDLWPVEIDPGQISQVVHNFVLNAQQAMGKGGKITIKASNVILDSASTLVHFPVRPGNYVEVSIADCGVGIPEEHLNKIFDPYFTTKQYGSGLGLATSYSIIKNHDGYVTVESKPGVGTTFRVYLPASSGKVDEPPPPPKKVRTGNGRVLVMDDEQIIREMAGELLVYFGYEPFFARDGAEAVEMYCKARQSGNPFDVVVMDLTVPGGMGGKDAIRQLREIDPKVKAIVSSGYSNDPVMADYKQYGFSGVVAKPYKIDEFGEAIRSVIKDSIAQ